MADTLTTPELTSSAMQQQQQLVLRTSAMLIGCAGMTMLRYMHT
jgi:hypothetical protein